MHIDRIESHTDRKNNDHYVTLNVSTQVSFDINDIARETGAEPLVAAAFKQDWRGALETIADYILENAEIVDDGGEWCCRKHHARMAVKTIEDAMRGIREYWEAFDKGE